MEFDFLKEAEELINNLPPRESTEVHCSIAENADEIMVKMQELTRKCMECANESGCYPRLAASMIILKKIWGQLDKALDEDPGLNFYIIIGKKNE